MHRHFFSLFIVAFFFVGCVNGTLSYKEDKVATLSNLLQTLTPQTTSSETMQLSYAVFTKTAQLSKEFKMTSPPQWHNFLVTIGVKEKGLCYHWADALYLYFIKNNHYPSFEFHLVGVNIGEYWTEHNSLVIVGKGKFIESGVIIDPWRKGGELYFSRVKDDGDYRWVHRPLRECQKGK